jgi:hypothetical protein
MTGIVSETEIFGISEGLVDVGTRFSLSLTFDDAAPDVAICQPNCNDRLGAYNFVVPPWSLVLQMGDYTVSADEFWLFVSDNRGGDSIEASVFATAVGGPLPTPSPPEDILVSFFLWEAGLVLSSDALTGVPWDLGLWDESSVQFGLIDNNDPAPYWWSYASGPIERLTIVPESSAALLIALGLGGLAARRRRLV